MSAALPTSRLIKVGVNLEQSAAKMQNLSDLLILANGSGVIDPVERYRKYFDIADIATDFGTASSVYNSAALWFEQSPQPSSLMIGRWAQSATNARLTGALLPASNQLISNWTSIVSGSFFITLNGIPLSITGLNFATATNLNAVAAIVQTALAAQSGSATVVWNSAYQRFEFNSGVTGLASLISFISSPTASGYFQFSNQPAVNDTITLNGTAITFVATNPGNNQCAIGANINATLSNLLTVLRSSSDAQILKFQYNVVGSTLYVNSTASGASGNALTISKSSSVITASGATLSGGSGSDISALLNATSTSSGAYTAQGMAAETASDCIALFDDRFGQKWYATTFIGAVNADHLAVAKYIEAANTKHAYGVTTQEGGVLTSTDTTNIAYQLKQLGYSKTSVQYSSSNPYAVVSYLARIMTTDYTGNNTVITLMWKQEPGIVAETLSTTQITNLEANNCNVFVEYDNDTAIIEPGVQSSGDYTDEVFAADWLALAVANDLWNALYTSPTKIPQTDPGNQQLETVIENRMGNAVDNGMLAPGVWTSAGFGSLATGDYLPKGYYIYRPPVSKQSKEDRQKRKSVLFQVAAKLAGAIHGVDVLINVNR